MIAPKTVVAPLTDLLEETGFCLHVSAASVHKMTPTSTLHQMEAFDFPMQHLTADRGNPFWKQ